MVNNSTIIYPQQFHWYHITVRQDNTIPIQDYPIKRRHQMQEELEEEAHLASIHSPCLVFHQCRVRSMTGRDRIGF